MKYESFFERAKQRGIEQSQIAVTKSSSFRVKLFHREVDTYTVSQSQAITATGICNGKFVSASSQRIDETTFDYLIDQMIVAAKFTEKPAEVDLFEGSPKYRKGFIFNKELSTIPAEKKVEMLHQLENAIYEADPRVSDADAVSYSESSYERIVMNSFGLRLKDKGNSYSFVAGAVIRDGEETKTFYDVFFDNDLSKFDPQPFAKKIVDHAISKLGGAPCEAKKYPTVIDREIMADLVGVLLDACSADDVQRHSSFLEGKLGTQIASKKLSIEENPFARTFFYYYFDDEGVAATRKTIIKNGVLNTYLHNRETAKKEGNGTQSTGNGRFGGRVMAIGYSNIFVKPGKQSFDEMIAPIQDGVYITEVAGFGQGLNPISGDFSCQAEGFRIRDGKVAEPLNLITLSGNILKLFSDLRCFDKELKMGGSGISISNAYIKKMNIGGL